MASLFYCAYVVRTRAGKNIVTTIGHHALFVLADTGTGTGIDRTTPQYDEENGDDGSGEGEQGQKGCVGVGEMEEAEIVPWEEWGSCVAARVISPPTFHWLSLQDDRLIIGDFSTARVRVLPCGCERSSPYPQRISRLPPL